MVAERPSSFCVFQNEGNGETRVSGREAQNCGCGEGREGVDLTRLGARPALLALPCSCRLLAQL